MSAQLAQTTLAPATTPAFSPAPATWRRGFDWQPPAKYQARRVIGTGGMGTVLLARDLNLDRLVAIKVLRTECETYLGRLRREARLLSRLEHSAIVRVQDLDVHDGRLFLAMEYVPGGNLGLARLEPVPLVRALRGVVDALGHAHSRGVVHRDVKPANILLQDARGAVDRGPALLSDFGLACRPNEGSESLRKRIVGTPLSMAPEQVRGDDVTPATDVFGFGVTLYQKLTGRWPFPGRTVDDVFDAILSREPARLTGTGSAVPRRLAAIVDKCLAKNERERFTSMEELGRALDRFVAARNVFSFARAVTLGRLRGSTERRSSGPLIHPGDPS